jgi:GT2 family glycosyltransferase
MNTRTVVDANRMPHVTAIVLNWCNESDTAACLRSLRASDYPALEILLVDNGSPDASGERLHATFADLAFLQTGRNLGYTGGNNRGIEWALARGADFVLILNNDTELDARCVSELLDAARSVARVGAVGPKILYADEPRRIWFGGGEVSRLRAVGRHRLQGELDSSGVNEKVEDVSFLTGCCLLIPAAVLREIGGFEEDFFAYIEDVDLSVRLTAAGYRLMYQPAARVFHREPVSQPAPSAFQILHRDRNRRRLVRRRYPMPARIAFALFFYPSRVARSVEYLVRGDTDRVRAIWHGMTAR